MVQNISSSTVWLPNKYCRVPSCHFVIISQAAVVLLNQLDLENVCVTKCIAPLVLWLTAYLL